MRAIICAIWVAIISVEDALLDVAPPTPETEPFSICIQLFGYRDLVVEARTQDQWGQACVVQQHWLVDTADWFAAETAVIVAVGLAEPEGRMDDEEVVAVEAPQKTSPCIGMGMCSSARTCRCCKRQSAR